MISSRLVQINDEASSTGKKLRKIYEDLDISVYDANGQLRSTFDILQDLSEKWATLDDNTKQYIALTSAGANQIQNFYALMTNFSTAVEASATAEKSLGSAWQENAKYMESIEAKTQKLKTSLEGLVLGNGGLQKLVGNILDLSTKIVNLVDSMGGLAVVIPILTGLIVSLNAKAIGGFLASVPKIITGLIQIAGSIVGVNTAIDSLALTMTLATGGVGLAIIAITTVIGLLVKSSKALEENENKLKEINNKVVQETSEIEKLNKQLEDLKWHLFDLKNQKTISITDEKDIENTAIEIAQLEQELKVKNAILQADQKKQSKTAEKVLNDKISAFDKENKFTTVTESGREKSGTKYTLATNLLGSFDYERYFVGYEDKLDERIKKYTNSLVDLNSTLAEVEQSTQDSYKLVNGQVLNKEEYISRLTSAIDEYESILSDLVGDLEESIVGLDENSEEYIRASEAIAYYGDGLDSTLTKEQQEQKSLDTISDSIERNAELYGLTAKQKEELTDKINEAIEASDDDANSIDIATQVTKEYIDALKEEEQEQEKLVKSFETWNEDLDDIQNAYTVLTGAVEEYNAEGGFSIDTAQSLLALSPEYLAMLEKEGDAYSFNVEKLKSATIAHINEGKAIIYANAIKQINALTTENQTSSTESAIDVLKTYTSEIYNNTNALDKNANALMKDAIAKATNEGASWYDINKIMKDAQNQIKVLDDLLIDVGKDFSGAMESGEQKANKARQATNKLKDSISGLQNEIKKYETAITYINKKIDEQIDKLEEAKDAELDDIDKRIDALEEAQDAEEKYWDEKIQALQEQNDALEDQLELEKLLEELETAKNTKVRVYREGQGFVWEADQDAIGKVNEKIEEYNRKQKYEQQLAELEKFKQDALDNYEAQIKDLENYKTQVEENYDAQIKVFEDYKNQFEKQVDSYEDEQSRLLTLQLTGIDFENDNWTTRLSNLNSFVEAYKAKLKELEEAQNAQNVISSSSSGSSSSYSGGTGGGGGKYKVNGQEFTSQSEAEKYANAQIANEINAFRQNVTRAYNSGTPMSQSYIDSTEQSIRNKYKISKYASGIGSVGDNQFALVGDSPNQELVIGSRLNGSLVNLKRGSGVVNAQSTNTLASLFNSIGGKGLRNVQSSDGFNGTNISIGNITLPEVKNGQDFVDYLQNFSNRMIQRAYAR